MANVDYDPRKAHEYYEKHKKLKGRRSTKGWNQSQKEKYAYAKSQLQDQRKSRDQSSRNYFNSIKDNVTDSINDAKQRQKEAIMKAAKARIDILRQQLKAMTPEQRKLKKEQINGVISTIREVTNAKKKQITANATEKKKGVREEIRNEKNKAKAKSKAQYESDLDKAHSKISRG